MLFQTSLLLCCMLQNTAFNDMSIWCISRLKDRMTFGWLALDLPLDRIGGGEYWVKAQCRLRHCLLNKA